MDTIRELSDSKRCFNGEVVILFPAEQGGDVLVTIREPSGQ